MAVNVLTGGTPSAKNARVGNEATKFVDGNTATYCIDDSAPTGAWFKYDLGAGVTKKVVKVRTINLANSAYNFKNFNIDGSNNDSDWATLASPTMDEATYEWQEFTFTNTTGYRYYRIIGTGANTLPTIAIFLSEMEMFEKPSAYSYAAIL